MKKLALFITTIVSVVGLTQLPASADTHLMAYAPAVAFDPMQDHTLNVAMLLDATTIPSNNNLLVAVTLNASATNWPGGGAPQTYLIDQTVILIYNGIWCGGSTGQVANNTNQTILCWNVPKGTVVQIYYAITAIKTFVPFVNDHKIAYQYITYPFVVS